MVRVNACFSAFDLSDANFSHPFIRVLWNWIEHDLERSLEDITNLAIVPEVLRDREAEKTSQWKCVTIGDHTVVVVNFSDGTDYVKVFHKADYLPSLQARKPPHITPHLYVDGKEIVPPTNS